MLEKNQEKRIDSSKLEHKILNFDLSQTVLNQKIFSSQINNDSSSKHFRSYKIHEILIIIIIRSAITNNIARRNTI